MTQHASSTRSTILLGGLALLALAFVAGWIFWPATEAPRTLAGAVERSDEGAGGVTVKAVLAPRASDDAWSFSVTLDTHTVDVAAFDLLSATRLEGGSASLRPTGDSAYGARTSHHVEATLLFDPLAGPATLVVRDLAGEPARRLGFP